MLPLVEFERLDQRDGAARPIDPETDGQEPLMIVPGDDFRTHEVEPAGLSLGDQEPHSVGRERNVVVTEEVVARSLDHLQYLVGRGPEPDDRVVAADEGRRHDGRDPGRDGFERPVVEHEDREVWMVLRCEGGECVFEPGSGVAGDDDRDDVQHWANPG